MCTIPRSPSSALLSPFSGEGSPTKIDRPKTGHPYSKLKLLEDLDTVRKKGSLLPTSLLGDLDPVQ